ncbi:hypothetical protein [Taibaiella helva]|uniref:hypothetical protein n=1 Tax=Taibaiella helva TaxID=2301235 RepID=UPI000E5676AE|nr:hypothetical protein [Taibaiella helva]
MKNALYEAIKSINIHEVDYDDRLELLKIFLNTENPLIRNHIAFIFSDLNYVHAIPSIIKKIEEYELYNSNGSLVFALESMDTLPYFLDIIRILSKQGYEARLSALNIIRKDVHAVSEQQKKKALRLLKKYKESEILHGVDQGSNSSMHFIEEAERLLQ